MQREESIEAELKLEPKNEAEEEIIEKMQEKTEDIIINDDSEESDGEEERARQKFSTKSPKQNEKESKEKNTASPLKTV